MEFKKRAGGIQRRMQEMTELREIFLLWMLKTGISQARFCEETGLDTAQFSRHLNGENIPGDDLLDRMREAMIKVGALKPDKKKKTDSAKKKRAVDKSGKNGGKSQRKKQG